MSYSHLSASERYTLYHLHTIENLSITTIALTMKRSKSTISRELKRNRINETLYLPDTAQAKMETRRQASKQPFMSVSDSTLKEIKQRLELYHSPEQICGRLEYEGLQSVSHETIYQMVYTNHQGLGEYQCYLRQGQKKRRRRQRLYHKVGYPDALGLSIVPPLPMKRLKSVIGRAIPSLALIIQG